VSYNQNGGLYKNDTKTRLKFFLGESLKDYYLHLFEYNDWANNLILKTLSEDKVFNQKAFSLFSHITISQILWLNRIKKEKYEFKDFWQRLTLDELNKFNKKSFRDWKFFIKTLNEKELQTAVSYINSRGNSYENTLAQIMTHVINHATYHRAQIASLLRAENINPPLTDYIAFFRQ
jgi:uncharacterized damage-inducible protein DinB